MAVGQRITGSDLPGFQQKQAEAGDDESGPGQLVHAVAQGYRFFKEVPSIFQSIMLILLPP
jgi:hypothetical protein